ncbi:unnamed protein product [Cuscuta europaea]|uniref:Glycosyltransferases n=1 Tax=Cuscuta europaea TaxID=41803 RepID=A0A9P0YRV4_CUSEU|nr:unnamed protein product [Cuscuta europaea]
MASIRRTLSPVPRVGSPMNGEACPLSSSPLSKSSLSNQNHLPPSFMFPSPIASLDYALFRAQSFIHGFISHRKPLERSKLRGKIWKRSLLHYFSCFVLGVFLGFTPFLSPILSPQKDEKVNNLSLRAENVVIVDNSTTSDSHPKNNMAIYGNDANVHFNQTMDFHKLLIVVTPTEPRPFQAYYLNHIAHTLKRVPPPLLWIVVEMNSQSLETADLLRTTGVMYRHLVCNNNKNVTEIKRDKLVHMRNAALSHIEAHRLDGIVYFADDDKTYSLQLFQEIRDIRRVGAWPVPRMAENKKHVIWEGPICKGKKVLGWHTDDRRKRIRRFQAQVSGFAFNSTILWDPKLWHRPTLQPIRLIHSVKDGFQSTQKSTFEGIRTRTAYEVYKGNSTSSTNTFVCILMSIFLYSHSQ